jgi:fatty acid desaturase
MNVVLKRIFIAAALVAVCAAILAAIKSYGVWVITGIAVLLFIFGLLRKEKAPDKAAGEAPDDRGEKSGQDKNP